VSDGLDASASSGTNKSRRLNVAMRGMNYAGAHEAFLLHDFEFQFRHIVAILANFCSKEKDAIDKHKNYYL
jgi:hypothetical protein